MLATRAQAEQLYKGLQEFTVDTVVQKQTKHFSEEGKHYEGLAHWWLGGVVAFGVVVAVIAYLLHEQTLPPGATAPALIGALLPRVVALSLAFWALTLCARNYRALRHNAVVNRHRATALSTFTVFAQAATDAQVKNAVLAQAAGTIFSAQPSGYSPDSPDPLPQTTALELLNRWTAK